jgi:uncharacterized protein (DUF1800 family)
MAKNLLIRRWPVMLATFVILVAHPIGPVAQRAAVPSDRGTIVHVLNRVTFGPRPGDVDRVAGLGLEAYLNAQLDPARLDDRALDARLAAFSTLTMSSSELVDKYFGPAQEAQRARQAQAARQPQTTEPMNNPEMMVPAPSAPAAAPGNPAATTPEEQRALTAQRQVINELTQARMIRAVESERQLQEVLTDFWFNHFNVFVGKGQVRQYLTEYERDVIRPNVLGSFRELLGKVAHSPAMLFYLDNWQSSTPNPEVRNPDLERRINDPRLTPQQRQRLQQRLQQMRPAAGQRPTRGINENYARELMELHTLGVDGGYTQQDVVELARILTGWTIDLPRQGGSFVFRSAMHDTGTKTLLGTTFGSAGEVEGERALDLLAAHPSTARHIAFKLTQRFVADEPPQAIVDRAAKVFRDTKGDLREVTRAILTSPEFLGTEYRRAKVKTPLEFVTSTVRATGATLVNAQPLVTALQNLGMPLYGSQPPTGYDTTAVSWVNTGALVARMNFAVDIVSTGRVTPQQVNGRGTPPPAGAQAPRQARGGRGQALRAPVQVPVREMAPDVTESSRRAVVDRLLHGVVASSTEATLARAETPQQLVALALGSPEFQRR